RARPTPPAAPAALRRACPWRRSRGSSRRRGEEGARRSPCPDLMRGGVAGATRWTATPSSGTPVLLGRRERLRGLTDLPVAGGAAAVDELRQRLQQELLHRGVTAVLPDGVELERVMREVVHLAASVRVLGEQVAAGADAPVPRRDDRAGDLGGVIEVGVLDVGADLDGAPVARGRRCGPGPRLEGAAGWPGLEEDRPRARRRRVLGERQERLPVLRETRLRTGHRQDRRGDVAVPDQRARL